MNAPGVSFLSLSLSLSFFGGKESKRVTESNDRSNGQSRKTQLSETRREDEVSRVGTRKYSGRKFAARGGMQDGAKKHEVADQHNWLEVDIVLYIGVSIAIGTKCKGYISVYIRR